jgi:hypothetical protein
MVDITDNDVPSAHRTGGRRTAAACVGRVSTLAAVGDGWIAEPLVADAVIDRWVRGGIAHRVVRGVVVFDQAEVLATESQREPGGGLTIMEMSRYLGLAQAERMTGVPAETLRRWVDIRKIRGVKDPVGRRLVLREDIERIVTERAQYVAAK